MKKIILGIIMMGLAGAALAIDQPGLEQKVRLLTSKFESMQGNPRTAIPAGILEKAKGIILLDRTKAGFLFAFQGGGGVALVRNGSGPEWSPASFVGANQVSLGFQAGLEQGFYAIVLMNTNVTRLLAQPNYEYSGEARGTAGDATGGPQSDVSALRSAALVFSDRKGLYGGADLGAGGIVPDKKANRVYYGKEYSAEEILFKKVVPPTAAAKTLADALNARAR